jgi:hypothetical protein
VDCLELDEILARHSDCNESFERQNGALSAHNALILKQAIRFI